MVKRIKNYIFLELLGFLEENEKNQGYELP